MTLDISFPLEFLVSGIPPSLQTKRTASIDTWKAKIRTSSLESLPEGHFWSEDPMAVTLFYFVGAENPPDLDNIVKPILDALSSHVFRDDSQVERLVVQKFDPDKIFAFSAPSPILAAAIQGEKPLLYVRLSNSPTEGLI